MCLLCKVITDSEWDFPSVRLIKRIFYAKRGATAELFDSPVIVQQDPANDAVANEGLLHMLQAPRSKKHRLKSKKRGRAAARGLGGLKLLSKNQSPERLPQICC